MIVLEILVPVPLNKTFYYLPFNNIDAENITGKRVKVQFNRKVLTAYAISCKNVEVEDEDGNGLELKRIIEVVDSVPVITEEAMELAKYISKNYVCSLGEALASIIPVSMKPPKKIAEKKNTEKGTICREHVLNGQQTEAVSLINESLEKNVYASFLLYGVTASGKTEVYIKAAEYVLKQNRSVIMLIPEISLAAQFVDVMTGRFGIDNVGVWHSAIGSIEKYNMFLKAKNGDAKIVIGTRSAVFVPFKNLGLVIIDEEHEHTYKQEQKPSYDAREIARWRGRYHNAVIVLGSATPSLESYKEALDRKIGLIKLSGRVDKRELPEIKILALKNKIFRASLLLPETIKAIS
jgi:primosomal protein N' (replication factor Y)